MSTPGLIYHNESVESTEDCVKLLNDKYKVGKWKRKTKFKLPNKNEVRVFADGNDVVSVVNTEEGTIICPEVNLSDLRPLIERIEGVCKKLYTHDYGAVWFNPYEMRLWFNGGDGGIAYFESESKFIDFSNRRINDEITDEEENNQIDAEEKVKELLPEVKIQFEAEHDPYDGLNDDTSPEDIVEEWEYYKEMMGFIPIANFIDACNIEGIEY